VDNFVNNADTCDDIKRPIDNVEIAITCSDDNTDEDNDIICAGVKTDISVVSIAASCDVVK
jgi:hypothetical protein